MKHSELKYYYTHYFGDQALVFSSISTIAQHRTLRLDYECDGVTFKFIRDEKE